MLIPRLYAIVDASCFKSFRSLTQFVEELLYGGVTLLQYRDKVNNGRQMLEYARGLKEVAGNKAKLVMNDRADMCLAAQFDGVHVGQDDLSVNAVREILGPNSLLGISTHRPDQIEEGDNSLASYLAIGPVFATSSKLRPDPVVGLEGVRQARSLTRKPLVAIGGISRQNAQAVIDAGADSVAVISDLMEDPRNSAEEFFRILR